MTARSPLVQRRRGCHAAALGVMLCGSIGTLAFNGRSCLSTYRRTPSGHPQGAKFAPAGKRQFERNPFGRAVVLPTTRFRNTFELGEVFRGGLSPSSSSVLSQTGSSENPESSTNNNRGSTKRLVERAADAMRRILWFSWWSQVILSVISSVTLLFARSVLTAGLRISSSEGGLVQVQTGGNFALAGTGLALSAASIVWTWGGAARLSNRLRRTGTKNADASKLIRRAVGVQVSLNLAGMLVTLVGAESIVGTLAAKVLTAQGLTPFGSGAAGAAIAATQTVQPLDILIVQGNTNTLFSHFISLCSALYLHRWEERLDPRQSR